MIWYFDQRFLEDPDIQAVLGSYGFDHTNELLFANGVWNPGCSSIYNRKGAGNFLFKNGFREYDGFYMPDYNDDFKQDWNEVTDSRCDWLRQHRFDKPWTVAWSGGNDSTTVMSAIMKNLSKSDFENITVACNNASVWENPEFFQKYIEPNFKIVNSSYLMSQKCIDDENYVIDGNLADQLFAGSVSLEMSIQENALLGQDIRKNADDLINYIAQAKGDPIRCAATSPVRLSGKNFAKWFYDTLLENISSVQIPIETLHDFFWWSYFNTSWVCIKLRMLSTGEWGNINNAGIYLNKVINWFDSEAYQSWAMTNNVRGKKYGSTVGEYKLAAKQYIYEFDKNNYTLKYKTKTHSSNHAWAYSTNWCCVLDDLTLLNCEQHKHQILDLLPYHLDN